MEKHERTLLLQLHARLGGAAAARTDACAHCAELLRTKQGSPAFLLELQRLASSYCPPAPSPVNLVTRATAAMRAAVGRDLSADAIALLCAAAQAISTAPPVTGERAMLELWMQRPEVFSESLSRVLLNRWRVLRNATPSEK